MFKYFKTKTKEYKIFFFILSGIIICLFLVLITSGIVGIINKVKQGHYIGADVAYKNTISVRGEGKVYAKPDIAIVNLSVVTEDRNIKEVQEENSKKMNGVIKFLKDFGIAETDIKTIRYRIYPRYSYEERKVPEIVGYEINQTLEVKIRNMEKIGEIFDKSVSVGINKVDSLRFKVDDEEKLKAEARKLAIENAKEKAKKLASELGVSLIKINGFTEDSGFEYPPYKEFGVGGAGAPQVEVGENEIVVSVTLIYEVD